MINDEEEDLNQSEAIDDNMDFFIRNLLEACGHAIRRGEMKQIRLKHNDLTDARSQLINNSDLKGVNESYLSFRREFSLVNIFEIEGE